jgi:hypothetical protein
MKKGIFKILKLVLVTGILYFFTFNLFIGLEGKSKIYPYIDTKFAADFSKKKFNLVNLGIKYNEVKNLIGAPLEFSEKMLPKTQNTSASFIASYSRDGKCTWSDFAWKSFDIYFNNDTVVIEKKSQWWYD